MQDTSPGMVTLLLQGVKDGQSGAADSLLGIAYEELGRLAQAHFSLQPNDHLLQPTALVHEAWMKLAGHLDQVEDRRHFLAVASQAMRQVLTDHARRRSREKREGTRKRITLDDSVTAPGAEGIGLIDLDDSLTRLARLNSRHARVVELRIFGGLTIEETAETLEVSHGTVERDWFTARAWLRKELGQRD